MLKFSKTGQFLLQIGTPGKMEGPDSQATLNRPTAVAVDNSANEVYVADRENNRIQIFTPDGEFLDIWPGFERPTKLYVGSDNVMYVAELEDRVSIVDLEGNVLGRFGSERSHDPGKFWGPHGIWTDSVGDLYVAEVLEGRRLQKFARKR